MAKKLIYNYTFDASAQTIVIDGNFKLRKLQLITNVTDGVIVYNFADPNKGGTVSYNSTNENQEKEQLPLIKVIYSILLFLYSNLPMHNYQS